MENRKREAHLSNAGIWTELAREIAPHVERAIDRAMADSFTRMTRSEAHAFLMGALYRQTEPQEEGEAGSP